MPLTLTPNPTEANVGIFIDYVASAGTQLTADLYRGLSATGPWTFLRAVDLLGQQAYQFDNTAPLDTPVWYRTVADDGTEIIAGPVTVVTDGTTGWLKDPGRPWADLALTPCTTPLPFCNPPDTLSWVGFEGFARPTDATIFEVHDDEKGVSAYARRKNLVTTIQFFSSTLAMKQRVYELWTAGGPLLLQLPPVYGWADDFLQSTGDLEEIYRAPDQRRPYRLWSADMRSVRRPTGDIQGTVCANWCAVNDAFATYAAFTAAAGDWGDVAEGTVQC
jgi:hypothetical protein